LSGDDQGAMDAAHTPANPAPTKISRDANGTEPASAASLVRNGVLNSNFWKGNNFRGEISRIYFEGSIPDLPANSEGEAKSTVTNNGSIDCSRFSQARHVNCRDSLRAWREKFSEPLPTSGAFRPPRTRIGEILIMSDFTATLSGTSYQHLESSESSHPALALSRRLRPPPAGYIRQSQPRPLESSCHLSDLLQPALSFCSHGCDVCYRRCGRVHYPQKRTVSEPFD
jgi:hypothetical protein